MFVRIAPWLRMAEAADLGKISPVLRQSSFGICCSNSTS